MLRTSNVRGAFGIFGEHDEKEAIDQANVGLNAHPPRLPWVSASDTFFLRSKQRRDYLWGVHNRTNIGLEPLIGISDYSAAQDPISLQNLREVTFARAHAIQINNTPALFGEVTSFRFRGQCRSANIDPNIFFDGAFSLEWFDSSIWLDVLVLLITMDHYLLADNNNAWSEPVLNQHNNITIGKPTNLPTGTCLFYKRIPFEPGADETRRLNPSISYDTGVVPFNYRFGPQAPTDDKEKLLIALYIGFPHYTESESEETVRVQSGTAMVESFVSNANPHFFT